MLKWCGHFTEKDIVSPGERTHAREAQGFQTAIDRARRYIKAGADIIFVYAPESLEEARRLAPFAERERLVDKPLSDAMERRYAVADSQP